MSTIKDLKEEVWKPNILGYGPSMGGKTRFIRTIRKVYKGPCYIFNFDPQDNLQPLVMAPGMDDVEFDQYDTNTGYDDMLKKIVTLKKHCPYELICIENVGVMHRVTLETILRAAGRGDSDGARIQDWGLAAERVKKRLKEIIDLPATVYATFHQQIEKDEIYGRATGRILIPGKFLPDEIPPMFNLVLHFVTVPKTGGAPDYKVQCKSDPLWSAGDKTDALDFYEEPDFEKMAAKIGKLLTAARGGS